MYHFKEIDTRHYTVHVHLPQNSTYHTHYTRMYIHLLLLVGPQGKSETIFQVSYGCPEDLVTGDLLQLSIAWLVPTQRKREHTKQSC